MIEAVAATISRHGMLRPGDRVIAAVSGGPDSVCLLEVLRTVVPQFQATLAGVAHFNHKLRGGASEEDQNFVAQLARRHNLPFFCESWNLLQGNLEQEARRARLLFFKSLIESGHAHRVAVGHTRDDQAETVLLRLMRGSGLTGLAGILPVTRDGLIRPLLDSTRSDIEAFLKESGSDWREDHTNLERRFARNRVRLDLLPTLSKDFNPRIAEALAGLADVARDEEVWWAGKMARLSRTLLTITPDGIEMNAGQLAALPTAVARRLVREAVRHAKGDLRRLEFQHVEQVVDLARREQGSGRVQIPGLTVTRSFDWLRLSGQPGGTVSPMTVKLDVTQPSTYRWPSAFACIDFQVHEREALSSCDTLETELCLRGLAGPLLLRGWHPGDAYWPSGRKRVHSLKDLFQELRVPSWRRVGWPILTYRDRIVWAMNFGPAQDLAPLPDFAGPVLRIAVKQV